MFRWTALIALAAALPAAAAAPAKSAGRPSSVGRLAQMGQWFVDQSGRVIILRGGNVSLPERADGGRIEPRWSSDTPAQMAAQGFNAVRLVVFLSDIMPRPGTVDTRYLDRVAHAVAAYKAAGIHVLIDFHQDEYGTLVGVRGMPDWAVFTDGHVRMSGIDFPMGYFNDPAVQRAFDNFWANHPVTGTGKGVQDFYIQALSDVARRFRSEPAVIGIDVMNEPATGSRCAQPDPVKANCPALEQELLRPFYGKASRAIARAAPDMIVFVEPFMLQGALGTPIDTPIVASIGRRALSFHNYGPVQATREKVSAGALAVAMRNRSAILNTEWGFTNDPAAVDDQANDFDKRLISWLAWPRGAFEALVDPALPDIGNGDRAQILRAYARPYPEATAGTPLALSFDSASGTARYRFTTRRPDGKPSARELLTDIRIPAISYPKGYRTTVTGGVAISPANASVLRIRSTPGVSTVSVTITRIGTLPSLASKGDPTSGSSALADLPPIPSGPLTRKSLIGHIVATPGGRALLDQSVPGMLTGLSQVHGWQKMTLVDIQRFAPGTLTSEKLDAMERAMALLKVSPGSVGIASKRLSVDSLTSDLLADPRARAIIARDAPGVIDAPQRGLYPQTTLRHLQPAMPAILTDAVLARLAADLAAPREQ